MRKIGRAGLLDQANRRVARSLAGGEELSGLGKLAFASLWLLVFAMSWEDAITIANFGTSARLIGMLGGVLGLLAIIGKWKSQAASARPHPNGSICLVGGGKLLMESLSRGNCDTNCHLHSALHDGVVDMAARTPGSRTDAADAGLRLGNIRLGN